ncbi:FK506-binding protein 4-like [Mangifera indica]|uniref:FK506-binding protein 4-like n=1 Tax=Mangifera indica TaxID=29780 RepID=UPI001CFB2901|nr:FK506-binding protein 4-like [Mangifera indica]
MQKIRCKGGKSIKSIEIKPPAKPEKKKEPEKEKSKEAEQKSEPVKEKPKETEKKKDADKPKEKKEAEKKTEDPKPTKPKVDIVDPLPKQKPAPTPNALEPELGYPPGYLNYPFGVCCSECYWGHGGGPCQHLGYGRPIWYDGYYGQPVYDSWGGGGGGCSIGNYGSRRGLLL